jgi:hypothetical protein
LGWPFEDFFISPRAKGGCRAGLWLVGRENEQKSPRGCLLVVDFAFAFADPDPAVRLARLERVGVHHLFAGRVRRGRTTPGKNVGEKGRRLTRFGAGTLRY